jgi:hypothetical protein
MNTQTLTQETMMTRIVELSTDTDALVFDSGTIYWVPGAEEWLLLEVNDQHQTYQFGSLEELVAMLPDADIVKYYEEDIAYHYEDEEVEEE